MKKRGDDRELLIDPRNQTNVKHQIYSNHNEWPHIFNLINCIVGVSVLAMPYCLQQCGILLGTILIGICSLLTKVTCHILYQVALLTRSRSIESMALHAFGNGGKHLVELLMILFLMSSVVSYMVVIGDIGPHVLADYLELQAPTQRLRILVMVLVFLFVILPLSLFRNLNSLSGISSAAVIFYFIFVLRMLIECIFRVFDGKWNTDIYWWRQEGLLTSLPIITMALSCQTQLFCVADCIKDPSAAKMDTIVSGAVNICSGMYAAVGLFGYVAFHDRELHGDILLYLQSSFFTQLLKLAFMLSVAVSIPLMLFPSRIAFYNLFLKSDGGEFAMLRMPLFTFILLTIVFLFFGLLLAVFVPNVEFILGITGAMIGSLVTIIIPSLLCITICHGNEECRSLVFYAKICLIVGSLMLIGSTWAVLHTEQERNVVDVILPKQIDNEKMENALKKLDMKIDVNTTKSLKRDFLKEIRKEMDGNSKEQIRGERKMKAQKLPNEINEEREELDKFLKEQRAVNGKLMDHDQLHITGKQRHLDLKEWVKVNGTALTKIYVDEKIARNSRVVNSSQMETDKQMVKLVLDSSRKMTESNFSTSLTGSNGSSNS